MALEGTHIRFALDLKKGLNVLSLDQYLSGTIYPDSRYLTKIDRLLTHNDNLLKKSFYQNDDFNKGWAVHKACNIAQYRVLQELFRDQLSSSEKKVVSGNNNWIFRTAIKILQDLSDINKFNIRENIQYLTYIRNPNGEDAEKIKQYNQIFIDLFNKDHFDIKDEFGSWNKLGIGLALLDKVKAMTLGLMADPSVMKSVEFMYDKMVIMGKRILEEMQ